VVLSDFRDCPGAVDRCIVPTAGAWQADHAGYLAPPETAWVHNVDGTFTDYVKKCDAFRNNCVNAWRRQGFWTIMFTWHHGSYQYWRMYGRMSSATITGVEFPWARTWLEFDNNGGWGGSPSEFEFPQPDQDYHGKDGAVCSSAAMPAQRR
jgi:hypothetical protein